MSQRLGRRRLKERIRALEQRVSDGERRAAAHGKAVASKDAEISVLRQRVIEAERRRDVDTQLRGFKLRMDRLPWGAGRSEQYVLQVAISPREIRYALLGERDVWNLSQHLEYVCDDLKYKIREFLAKELTKDGVFR